MNQNIKNENVNPVKIQISRCAYPIRSLNIELRTCGLFTWIVKSLSLTQPRPIYISLAGRTNIVLILLYTGIQVYGLGEAFESTVLQMNKGKIL